MSAPPKKKAKPTKQCTIAETMFKTRAVQIEAATKLHVGNKKVLLKATSLYSKKNLPIGEEKYIFQYHVIAVNDDLKTCKLEYETKFIVEGGREFQNYPLPESDDMNNFIDEYRLELLPKDAELYKKYLGIVNKDKKDAEDKLEKEQADIDKEAAEDVEDMDYKIMKDELPAFDVLKLEFEAVGDLVEHIMDAAGKDKGKVNSKQQWSK
jgi:hypothetical protein